MFFRKDSFWTSLTSIRRKCSTAPMHTYTRTHVNTEDPCCVSVWTGNNNYSPVIVSEILHGERTTVSWGQLPARQSGCLTGMLTFLGSTHASFLQNGLCNQVDGLTRCESEVAEMRWDETAISLLKMTCPQDPSHKIALKSDLVPALPFILTDKSASQGACTLLTTLSRTPGEFLVVCECKGKN